MTATNMCSNFGSKWYSRPLNHPQYKIVTHSLPGLQLYYIAKARRTCTYNINNNLNLPEYKIVTHSLPGLQLYYIAKARQTCTHNVTIT